MKITVKGIARAIPTTPQVRSQKARASSTTRGLSPTALPVITGSITYSPTTWIASSAAAKMAALTGDSNWSAAIATGTA